MKKVIIILQSLLLIKILCADAPNLFINEFLASNASTNLDPDFFSFCDWIEIYNSEDTVVNISGYYISDNLSNPFKFELPDNSIIHPNSFFIVWADNKNYYPGNYHIYPEDIDINVTTCHTNFKLKKSDEEIGLFNSDGDLIDAIVYEQQITNISYGRKPDGNAEWFYFSEPTPSDSNISVGYSDTIRASTPLFSTDGGFYTTTQIIEIYSENTSGTIRFTLDGSKPNINSELYNTPIVIDSTTVIRAKVFQDSILSSITNTMSYFINETSTLPVISVAIDPELLWDDQIGIYTDGTNGTICHGDWGSRLDWGVKNYWQDWERPISLEFYQPSGIIEFKANMGIKTHGGYSRTFPQKSFTFHARNKYGIDEINYQLFSNRPIENFSSFMLRNGGTEGIFDTTGTMLVGGIVDALVYGKINLDSQGYEPSILYINGNYWGIYNIRERINTQYVNMNYQIEEDNVNMLAEKYGRGGYIIEGDMDNYNELVNYIELNDLSLNENYNYIETQIDIDEIINYQILEFYIDNGDWPQNNYKFWRSNIENGKWRWILFDTDCGFGNVPSPDDNLLEWAFNYEEHPYGYWSKTFLHSLLSNASYVNELVQRFASQLNYLYNPERVIHVIDSLKSNIELEMPRNLTRWESSDPIATLVDSMIEWENNIESYREFAFERPNIIRQYIIDYFNLSGLSELTLNISNTNAGIITVHDQNIQSYPDTGIYFKEIPIRIAAIPNTGFRFLNWEGISSDISDSSSIALTILDDSTITAVFEYVNLAPELANIDSQYVNEDQSFEYVLAALDGNEEDNLIYSAESFVDDVLVGVSNDTLSILLTENWNGLAELFVYVSDGELADTTSFILTVNAVNDPPELIGLISPDDGTQISITNQDIYNGLAIAFNWEESNDVDNDVLEYHFKFYNGIYSETSTDIIIDTVIITNSLEIPYQNLVDLIVMTGDNILSGQWFVNTSDGIEIVMSDEVWNISIEASEVLSIDGNILPEVFALHQNYPNPFNPTTQIRYDLPEDKFVSIAIYDVMGRKIRSLMNADQAAGYHTIRWDAKNDTGEGVAAGMYIYTLQAGEFRATKKMVLLK